MAHTHTDWFVRYFNGRNVRDKNFSTYEDAIIFKTSLNDTDAEIWHRLI